VVVIQDTYDNIQAKAIWQMLDFKLMNLCEEKYVTDIQEKK
jgi:hypothetical protein